VRTEAIRKRPRRGALLTSISVQIREPLLLAELSVLCVMLREFFVLLIESAKLRRLPSLRERSGVHVAMDVMPRTPDTIEQAVCRQRTKAEDRGVEVATILRGFRNLGLGPETRLLPRCEPLDLD